ncbi:MAG: DNA topoisomerase I [Bdellovibrionaceae bacterium]|nr:DNA topoisomerase I [Pseudobdellovibrionaceae bacterium]
MAKSANGKKLVVVESPTKARTIRKFLGKDFLVESCMGHVRDLPKSAKEIPEKFKKEKWATLGVNVDKDFDPIYTVPKNKTKVITTLKGLMKEADELILATDEDREGESISWHLLETLKPKIPVKRMVFHEITKEAIKQALDEFRDIDYDLVRAQEARRVLDRLVGYTISPLLWKKVAYGLSAGRVQSVAVRLISEREHERIRFVKTDYWGLQAALMKDKVPFDARLQSYDQQRIASGKDFDSETGGLLEAKKGQTLHLKKDKVDSIVAEIKGKDFVVSNVEEKPVSRKPAPPFITSTLQQESNRKLGLSSRETMQVAQKLYERGFITYMRTDSTNLSTQAITAARDCILERYGKDYLPPEPRDYTKKKAKGAQEAHEAIRPAGTSFVLPEETGLKGIDFKLYDLIWKRTVACQMVNAQQKQVLAKLSVGKAVFSASGMTIEFPGFLKAYVEGKDDPDAALDDREVRLPKLVEKDAVTPEKLKPTEHETKPPARYTEATLVQKMEKEGIGRPSTYASIIGTIQDRGYVKKVGNALVPTFTALVVSKLLTKHFPELVDLNFTSEMENSLDDIAQGELDQIKYLSKVYHGDKGLRHQVELKEKAIDPEESRAIELSGLEELSFRIGRYGAYVCRVNKETGEEVCASIPENFFPGDMDFAAANKLIDQKLSGADALGKDPETDLPVYVLTGRYGPYVQLGDATDEDAKPKRMALPPGVEVEDVDLQLALKIVELPKTLGNHPETDKVVKKGIGRFGPYVVHDGDFRSIPKDTPIFDVDMAFAMNLLSQPKKGRGRASALKELGEHPETGDQVQVFNGKYGPYVKAGSVNASLPEDQKPEEMTLEMAVDLLAPKIAAKGAKKKTAKKKTAKKKTAKKAAAKTEIPRPIKSAASSKKSTVKKKTASTAKKKVIRRKKSD